eukprot:gene10722-14387_t
MPARQHGPAQRVRRHPWVRDVTISNSTFGNRYVRFAAPHLGVHALGGGIGQGVAMGIGAALAGAGAKAITLLGDGGAMLGLAEMITAVDEKAPLVYVLMNDQAYGVIQNIQDAQYQSRRHYSALAVPDLATFCASIRLPHRLVRTTEKVPAVLAAASAAEGPCLIEIDMCAIGPFATSFAGPPAGAAGKQHAGHSLSHLTVLVRSARVDDTKVQLAGLWPGLAVSVVESVGQLLAERPDLVVECAGQEAVQLHAAAVLEAGVDLVLVSIGALSDSVLHERLRAAAIAGR